MNVHPASSTPRFYVDITLSPGAEFPLPESPARHVSVLRLREGDPVTLFNGRGGEFAAALTKVAKETVRVRVGRRSDPERESPLDITLALGISAGERMDYALQKATELGVSRIHPLATERSVVRLSPERAARRLTHWRNIVVAACEQCGRNHVPEVAAVGGLSDFLVKSDQDALRVVLAAGAASRLRDLAVSGSIVFLIGSEGGLTPEERSRAEQSGFRAVALGPRILRAETAPLAAIAAIQALRGDA